MLLLKVWAQVGSKCLCHISNPLDEAAYLRSLGWGLALNASLQLRSYSWYILQTWASKAELHSIHSYKSNRYVAMYLKKSSTT